MRSRGDIVRFVDGKGKVQDSYTYGENGSFSEDFTHIDTKVGSMPINGLRTDNIAQADKLFDKISQNSNIEWEHLLISNESGWHDFAVLGNTGTYLDKGERKSVGFSQHYYLPKRMKELASNGYRLKVHEHTHPGWSDGTITDWPSGYYRKSREVNYNDPYMTSGDGAFARGVRANKTFSASDIKFYIRARGANHKVEYDGEKPYKHVK